MNKATVLSPGLYSTFQDKGRLHASRFGIPIGGAMDMNSYALANEVLDNASDCACIETTAILPTIYFEESATLSIVGGVVQPFINGRAIKAETIIHVPKGSELSFGPLLQGYRIYIGVRGGFYSTMYFNSRSASPTAGIGNILLKGDTLHYPSSPSTHISKNTNTDFSNIIPVFLGPEAKLFSNKIIRKICKDSFSILPSSNRMALRLDHSKDLKHAHNIISSPTLPGTVQLTPSGELIILMRDAQTTGGYPRIFQVSEQGINYLAQLRPHGTFSFLLQEF